MFEGLNLLHALIYGGHQDLVDKYHEGAVASEVAALIHYGTTVSSYISLDMLDTLRLNKDESPGKKLLTD